MDLFFSASIIAAFIAGVAALFAPCCITVLLPAYFASVFREKYKVFLMTFIFFLGILAVFLPIGLGAAALGQFFSRYHNQIFGIGGVFLVILGLFLIFGKHLSLPWKANPVLRRHNAVSIFVLGIFSGIATTCCAPVLAGVLSLSVLPGSVIWGGIYALSYVFGMVAPLFLVSLFLDKINFTKKITTVFYRQIEYSFLGNKFRATISQLISGIAFLAMGLLILYLSLTNRLFAHSSYQTDINIFLTKILGAMAGFTRAIPESVWAILLLVAVAVIVKITIKQLKNEKYDEKK